ncbi:helix-turn-helix domain-containing protein [bacterium]|nr:helix-turn-helix domain-containing protein [bacterium]
MTRRVKYTTTPATRFTDSSFRFAARHSDNRMAVIPFHAHEFMEIEFVLRGVGIYVSDDAEYPMNAGDVFVVSPGGRHGYRDRDKCEVANVQFDPAEFLPHDNDITAVPSYHALFVLEPLYRALHHFESRLRLGIHDIVQADRLITGLENECLRKAPGYATAVKGLFTQLIVLLCRAYLATTAPAAQVLIKAGTAIRHIDQHCNEPVAIATLARVSGLSVNQLLRVFRQATGQTPHDYQIHQRILKATKMLRETSDAITPIAYELGFADSSHFSRHFKRIMGLTPQAYRRHAATA